jgi:hypothetical protein
LTYLFVAFLPSSFLLPGVGTNAAEWGKVHPNSSISKEGIANEGLEFGMPSVSYRKSFFLEYGMAMF